MKPKKETAAAGETAEETDHKTEEPVAEENTETAEKEVSDALEKCRTELEECKDKYLRMLAEYDNYRKRTQKEREGVYADALSDAIGAFLPVLDNLARAAAVDDATKIAEGLALTVKQAHKVLDQLKVEETAKVGDTFDPNIHNAVMHVEDDTHGEGEIVEVFQPGYRRGDKIIRHAMVKVAN